MNIQQSKNFVDCKSNKSMSVHLEKDWIWSDEGKTTMTYNYSATSKCATNQGLLQGKYMQL